MACASSRLSWKALCLCPLPVVLFCAGVRGGGFGGNPPDAGFAVAPAGGVAGAGIGMALALVLLVLPVLVVRLVLPLLPVLLLVAFLPPPPLVLLP